VIEDRIAAMVSLPTGKVLFNGEVVGQSCDLCPSHRPLSCGGQPVGCTKVSFRWSSLWSQIKDETIMEGDRRALAEVTKVAEGHGHA